MSCHQKRKENTNTTPLQTYRCTSPTDSLNILFSSASCDFVSWANQLAKQLSKGRTLFLSYTHARNRRGERRLLCFFFLTKIEKTEDKKEKKGGKKRKGGKNKAEKRRWLRACSNCNVHREETEKLSVISAARTAHACRETTIRAKIRQTQKSPATCM